jgi:hypothetical protein
MFPFFLRNLLFLGKITKFFICINFYEILTPKIAQYFIKKMDQTKSDNIKEMSKMLK